MRTAHMTRVPSRCGAGLDTPLRADLLLATGRCL